MLRFCEQFNTVLFVGENFLFVNISGDPVLVIINLVSDDAAAADKGEQSAQCPDQTKSCISTTQILIKAYYIYPSLKDRNETQSVMLCPK